MTWIKCSERLPELTNQESEASESDNVLILNSDGNIYVARLIFYPVKGYRTKEEYDWSEQSSGCGCCCSILNPTYWIPLPIRPKQE
jgi:hypothetical protein